MRSDRSIGAAGGRWDRGARRGRVGPRRRPDRGRAIDRGNPALIYDGMPTVGRRSADGLPRSGARMARRIPQRLSLVYAGWCPHCVPISTERLPRLAARLSVPSRPLDIDLPAEEVLADELVRRHGDWTEDYLIPQLFLEWSDGTVDHLLTGVPGSVEGTRRAWERLLSDEGIAEIRGRGVGSRAP